MSYSWLYWTVCFLNEEQYLYLSSLTFSTLPLLVFAIKGFKTTYLVEDLHICKYLCKVLFSSFLTLGYTILIKKLFIFFSFWFLCILLPEEKHIFIVWMTLTYVFLLQSIIFDEIELTDLSVAECSTKNINHSFQVSK